MAHFGLWVSGHSFKKNRRELNKANKSKALATPKNMKGVPKSKRWAVDKDKDMGMDTCNGGVGFVGILQ